jgi:hypothetical protein
VAVTTDLSFLPCKEEGKGGKTLATHTPSCKGLGLAPPICSTPALMAFREGSRAVEWISQQALESGSLFDEGCGKGRKPERRERRDRRGKETKSEHQMDRYWHSSPFHSALPAHPVPRTPRKQAGQGHGPSWSLPIVPQFRPGQRILSAPRIRKPNGSRM